MTQISLTPVPADLINLPGDAFVAQATARLGVKDMSPREHHALAQAIYRGVNKSRIWESLSARSDGRAIAPTPHLPTSLVRSDDDIAIQEVLIDHAPEDDAIFIDYAFFRLVGRDAELSERFRIQGALADGRLDRQGAIREIMNAARSEGGSPVVATMGGDQPFALISADRSERLVLIKKLGAQEYLVADGALHNARVVEGGVELSGGLALTGPKRALRPGLWRLNVDWGQDEEAVISIDVTANGGAEKLMGLTLAGSAVCSLEFRVAPEHLVSEVLIHGVRKGGADHWLARPREVSVNWVSE